MYLLFAVASEVLGFCEVGKCMKNARIHAQEVNRERDVFNVFLPVDHWMNVQSYDLTNCSTETEG